MQETRKIILAATPLSHVVHHFTGFPDSSEAFQPEAELILVPLGSPKLTSARWLSEQSVCVCVRS